MAVYLGMGNTVTEQFVTGDIGYVPTGAGHYIRNTGKGIVRLLVGINNGHYHAHDLKRMASLESARCVGWQCRTATNGRGIASQGDALYRTTPGVVRVLNPGERLCEYSAAMGSLTRNIRIYRPRLICTR